MIWYALQVAGSVTVWMFQLFGNSLSLQKLWRCNPELLKEERQIDLTSHWLLRSFKVTLTFRRFLLLPVIFLIKMMIIVITMITKCFLSFPCTLYVVGEFIFILFLAISHRQSRRFDPEAKTALNSARLESENNFVSRMLHSVIHIKLHALRAAECACIWTHTRWHWHTIMYLSLILSQFLFQCCRLSDFHRHVTSALTSIGR